MQTKDALGNIIANRYDLLGHKVQMNDSDKGVIFTCFDPLGQAKAEQTSAMRGGDTLAACPTVTAAGITATAATNWATMAYDQLGRMTDRIEPDYRSTWSYDKYADNSTCTKGIGKLCEAKTTNGVDKKYN